MPERPQGFLVIAVAGHDGSKILAERAFLSRCLVGDWLDIVPDVGRRFPMAPALRLPSMGAYASKALGGLGPHGVRLLHHHLQDRVQRLRPALKALDRGEAQVERTDQTARPAANPRISASTVTWPLITRACPARTSVGCREHEVHFATAIHAAAAPNRSSGAAEHPTHCLGGYERRCRHSRCLDVVTEIAAAIPGHAGRRALEYEPEFIGHREVAVADQQFAKV